MNKEFFKLTHRSRKLFGLSPWLVVGVSVILGLVVIFLAVRSNAREKQKMSENLTDKANALIWALEAGTRTWMGNHQGERNLLQLLVEETASQPGIVYLLVADFDGSILAHSDKAEIGRKLSRDSVPVRADLEKVDWRVADSSEPPVFEVYRRFVPVRSGHGMGMGMGMGRGRHHSRLGLLVGESGGDRESFVLVGLDMQPFEEALHDSFHNTLLSAIIVAALGLGGFISMFWAHNYRRSSRLLMDMQALASEVITSLPLGLITCDAGGAIGIVNDVALSMLGKPGGNLAGRSLDSLPALEWKAVIAELGKGGKVLEREVELTLSEDRNMPIRLSASRIHNAEGVFLGHIFILGDMGEVKRLQNEVQRNERLTALGNLAAGVAHEIRNPLSTIKGLATYISGKLPQGGAEEDAARTMIVEVNRLNAVVSELLEFARPSAARGALADVNEVIGRALRLADADIRDRGIVVDFVPDADTPPVRLNPERFTQALLNLFLNAVQAMPRGGTLRVHTRARPADGDFRVIVEDNGEGMSDEVRESIFNPYFTTKPSGTGLGLAIVHQIVEGHGGKVTVKSVPGEGSAFAIHLPIEKTA